MTTKRIRVWNGCTVVYTFDVSESGSSSSGAVGGAANSGVFDIEIDPWAGLIVDHGTTNPPLYFREEQP